MSEQSPLRLYREAHDPPLTLEQFGAMFGVNKSTAMRWEERVPAERVIGIAEVTGIPPHKLRPDLYPSSPVTERVVS
jgi:DNA-binding transcriptional regulator YdaS (Cro superfamily)